MTAPQDTPNPGFGIGSTAGSDYGKTGNSGSMGGGSGMGSSGSMGSPGSMGATGGATDAVCPTCGQATNRGLEQFLGRLGITEDMLSNLKSSFQNVDVDEYLNTARDYLKSGGTKASSFAKENPGKVAAGAAVLAVGAGLLIAALNKDKD
jgi:hypothetical protein